MILSLATAAAASTSFATACRTEERADAALVLGAAVWSGGRPSPALRSRALAAARAYGEGRVRVVVTSGGVGAFQPSEAAAAAGVLSDAGVPPQAIVLDERATSTEESAEAFGRMARERGWVSVIVATDPYHQPRSQWLLRDLGLRASGVCADEGVYRPGVIWFQRARELGGVLYHASARGLLPLG
jgi:uncharacterized SAM-binding protein YcdF (DUF218 family)